ncbi:MAG: O-antigen ligase family protein, partial [Anaerolineales bacterium]
DLRADELVLNLSRLRLLREVMVRHGDDDKALWASQWGWNALPQRWAGAPSIWGETDEEMQAAYSVSALERARLEWPWMGAMIVEHLQPEVSENDARWGFALLTPGGDPRPVFDAISHWAAGVPDAAPPGGHPAESDWATYGEGWSVGPLGADAGPEGSRATFTFDGTAVAITVRRADYPGFFYASVDGQPASELPLDESGRSYVVLYDSGPSVATVRLARGLEAGVHTVDLVAEGAQGEWALVDWRVAHEPAVENEAWKLIGLSALAVALAALLIRDGRRADWTAVNTALRGCPEWTQVLIVSTSVALLWLSAGASWGRDWASPLFVVSLLSVALTAALFALRLDLGLALVALTAPFYLIPGNLPYGALSLPELLVLLCAASLVFQMRQGGSKRAVKPGGMIDFSVLLLAVAALVATLLAADLWAALHELRTVFLLPAGYYAVLRAAHLAEGGRRAVLGGLVLGGVGVALVGLAQYALGSNVVIAEGGLPRLGSVYSSPNNVGLYLGRVWPLALAVALWAGSRRRRLIYAAGAVVVTAALVLSFSRGALLLGLPVAVLVMGWRAGGVYRRGALVLVALLALTLVPLLRVPRFASLLDLEQGSSFFRLQIWQSSVTMIGESPWLGVGPGNFLEAYRTRFVLPSAWQEFNQGHPHNIVLDFLVRTGPLGLLAGVIAQVGFWRALAAGGQNRAVSLGLGGSMAALLAHGLVDGSLFFPDLAVAYFALLALAQLARFTEASAPGAAAAPSS